MLRTRTTKQRVDPRCTKSKMSVLKIFFFQILTSSVNENLLGRYLLSLYFHTYVPRLLKLVVPLWWGLVWGLAGASPPLRDCHRAARTIEGQVALPVCWAVSRPLAPMKPPWVWRPQSQWQPMIRTTIILPHYYFAPYYFAPYYFAPLLCTLKKYPQILNKIPKIMKIPINSKIFLKNLTNSMKSILRNYWILH
jgi:hypothetical protein